MGLDGDCDVADDEYDPNAFLVLPIADMVKAMGLSVAEASREMLETQLTAMADPSPEMAKWGLQPVLYHMQSVEVELRLAIHLTEEVTHDPAAEDGGLRKWWKRNVTGAPINNGYTKGQTFDARGASSLRMQFAPGPPPNEWGGDGR